MGDRRNVIVKDDRKKPGVALYTHWGGSELPEQVKAALAKRWRWNDAPYLARIIFCQMVKGEEQEETGFGITTTMDMCEESERDIVVDVAQQRIRLGEGKPWKSFEAFVSEELVNESG